MTLLTFAREILRGKDLYRILMNKECERHTLSGLTVDVGGGAGTPSYLRFFKRTVGTTVESVDQAALGDKRIDLEKDKLPYNDASADVVLGLNVLEHVFNYGFLLSEMRRIIRPQGSLIIVVPFLINYHPDPSDFWRYTKESLNKLLVSSGFTTIEVRVLGTGPFGAAFSQIEWLTPRFLKLLCIPFVLFLDRVVRFVRPSVTARFPLGFFVTARK
ncbi:MAG: methyltransferase domain-containing protein [bacterium]|nr:methyltransferase domain-containing protein [bacterium]